MDNTTTTIKKMLLNATLKANLDTLKYYLPSVYELFKDYNPKDSGVVINEKGNIDLYNQNQYVYEGVPEDFAKQQVNIFVKSPLFFDLKMEKIVENTIRYEHQRVLKKIVTKRQEEVKVTPNFDEKRFDFVCMLGVGLGYQIEELLAQKQVQHLYLCEPSEDIFYAMLHCIELRPIFEHCIGNGGGVIINTGNNDDSILNGIDDVLKRIGRFYLPRFYLYKHYDSATTDSFISKLKTMGYRLTFGWGFMEDEIIGLEHTLANLKLGYKVCKKPSKFINNEPDRPVFIIANGPSLDFSLKFLKENQNEIIIISCGTTLRVLLKHNIRPDIHVENERPVELLPYIEEIEQQQINSDIKLKDIQIITLNTVYPEILKKFKTPLLLNKLNDVGGEFIDALDTSNIYIRPSHSNPTCPNTAAALVTALGFKEIYFIGTDFGYVSNDYHHSKDSIYYQDKFRAEAEKKDRIDAVMTQDIQVKGNFREFVFSNQVFDSARKQINDLLASNLDVNAYNCADGALIKHAEPTRIKNIKLSRNNRPKEVFLEELLSDAFDNKPFTEKRLDKSIKKTLHVLKVTLDQLMLILDRNVNSREELADLFTAQHAIIKQLSIRKEYQFNYWMIQGTFQYLQTYIMSESFMYDNLTKRNEFMNYSLMLFKEHIDLLYKKLNIQY